MSEDRLEQEEPKDEDVEAHGHTPRRDIPATDDLDSDDSDDVEAHRKRALTDELKDSDEGSDDFELHRKRA
jgi:hypothetical protein